MIKMFSMTESSEKDVNDFIIKFNGKLSLTPTHFIVTYDEKDLIGKEYFIGYRYLKGIRFYYQGINIKKNQLECEIVPLIDIFLSKTGFIGLDSFDNVYKVLFESNNFTLIKNNVEIVRIRLFEVGTFKMSFYEDTLITKEEVTSFNYLVTIIKDSLDNLKLSKDNILKLFEEARVSTNYIERPDRTDKDVSLEEIGTALEKLVKDEFKARIYEEEDYVVQITEFFAGNEKLDEFRKESASIPNTAEEGAKGLIYNLHRETFFNKKEMTPIIKIINLLFGNQYFGISASLQYFATVECNSFYGYDDEYFNSPSAIVNEINDTIKELQQLIPLTTMTEKITQNELFIKASSERNEAMVYAATIFGEALNMKLTKDKDEIIRNIVSAKIDLADKLANISDIVGSISSSRGRTYVPNDYEEWS